MSIGSAWHVMTTAMRGMQSTQWGVSIANDNIANANDPNYTRRRAITDRDMVALNPGVLRDRDTFLDAQYRLAQGNAGDATSRQNWMRRVEDVFGDPVNGSFNKAIDGYYRAWKDVESDPNDNVARMSVIAESRRLMGEVQRVYSQINESIKNTGEELYQNMQEVNQVLQRIQELNTEISKSHRNQAASPEFEDQRDAAIDRLAKLTGAVAVPSKDGAVNVYVGSTPVVQGPTVVKMTMVAGTNGPVPQWEGFPPGGAPIAYNGAGSIGGTVKVRDTDMVQLRDEIVRFTDDFAAKANEVHEAGYGKTDSVSRPLFIQVGGPVGWQLNEEVTPDTLAAATNPNAPADNANAQKMLDMQDDKFMSTSMYTSEKVSPRQFYRLLIGFVGNQARSANQGADVAKTHVQSAEQARQSAYGVSVDEEITNLQLQQRAYQAATTVIRTQDEMIDTLINRMMR